MRSKIAFTLLIAATAAAALGGCMASAAAHQPAQVRSGTEQIWVSDFSPATLAAPTEVVATGLFTDAGHVTGKGPIDKGAIFDIRLSRGVIVANKWHKAHLHYHLDTSTCLVTLSATGSLSLVSGTGAYKGVSGSLAISGHEYAVLPRLRNGTCNQSASTALLGAAGMIAGTGKVTISG
jgi:hypothetical protein